MRTGVEKSLYVFLCTIMGAILFLVLQQAAALIHYALLSLNYQTFGFGLSVADLQTLNTFTVLLALFMGGWYGTWLGMHWFHIVYEQEQHHGLFYGFLGRWRHRGEVANNKSMAMPSMAMPKVKPVAVIKPRVVAAATLPPAPKPAASKPAWNFEELIKSPIPAPTKTKTTRKTTATVKVKTTPTAKPVVRKTVRKTVVRKSTVLEPEPEFEV